MKLLSGIDIVNNQRIKKLLERSPDAVFDIFSKKEIEYCNKKKHYEQSFGARFAVKEAVLKATDSGIFEFKLYEIETTNLESGKPVIHIHSAKLIKKIKEKLEKEEYDINVSLSHEKDYSIAHVIIY
jgi:holo-[acyl-carrier protein] synthase